MSPLQKSLLGAGHATKLGECLPSVQKALNSVPRAMQGAARLQSTFPFALHHLVLFSGFVTACVLWLSCFLSEVGKGLYKVLDCWVQVSLELARWLLISTLDSSFCLCFPTRWGLQVSVPTHVALCVLCCYIPSTWHIVNDQYISLKMIQWSLLQ